MHFGQKIYLPSGGARKPYFIARGGGGLELATLNPTTVLGPALGSDYSHSIRLIKNMLDGQPGCPKINTCLVDVRDVADLHRQHREIEIARMKSQRAALSDAPPNRQLAVS